METGQAHRTLDELVGVARRISAAVETVIEGKPEAIRLALTVLLAEGHLLIEDVPGVGKTLLAKTLARSIDCSIRRVQFTPDLLPSDLTGVSAFNQELREFEFKPGPIFANLVIGDEINRASPKTQSALLECMEERQVTVDGSTYPLELPFMVIATQNPIEHEGTYPLPESQLDRFLMCITLGYPDRRAERALLAGEDRRDAISRLQPVMALDELRTLIAAVPEVHASDALLDYLQALIAATRSGHWFTEGLSPRAGIGVLRLARARALLAERDFVSPDDVQAILPQAIAHRLIPVPGAGRGRREQVRAMIESVSPEIVEQGRVRNLRLVSGDQRIAAEFVEDVLVRYTITPK
jgi:MoxR-like ATPase